MSKLNSKTLASAGFILMTPFLVLVATLLPIISWAASGLISIIRPARQENRLIPVKVSRFE